MMVLIAVTEGDSLISSAALADFSALAYRPSRKDLIPSSMAECAFSRRRFILDSRISVGNRKVILISLTTK